MFDKLSKKSFNSIELLINMNSFGFVREACHALGTSFSDKTIFDDLAEYDPSEMDKSSESVEELNAIAGGDYRQDIINGIRPELLMAMRRRQNSQNNTASGLDKATSMSLICLYASKRDSVQSIDWFTQRIIETDVC